LVVLLLLAGSLYLTRGPGQADPSPALFYLVGVPLFLVFFFIFRKPLYRLLARRGVRQMLREGNNVRILEPQRLTLTPEGVTHTSALAANFADWSAVEKVVATADHAFIYTMTNAAYVVPRRAFEGEREFLDFVETARRYHQAAAE